MGECLATYGCYDCANVFGTLGSCPACGSTNITSGYDPEEVAEEVE